MERIEGKMRELKKNSRGDTAVIGASTDPTPCPTFNEPRHEVNTMHVDVVAAYKVMTNVSWDRLLQSLQRVGQNVQPNVFSTPPKKF